MGSGEVLEVGKALRVKDVILNSLLSSRQLIIDLLLLDQEEACYCLLLIVCMHVCFFLYMN